MTRPIPETNLLLDRETRAQLWTRLIETIENYTQSIPGERVTPELAPQRIRTLLAACDFEQPMEALEAVDFVAKGLAQYQTHTPHPRYYGLFNPAPTTMGIAADALVAAFNPQMAAWSHSPLAVEIEQHLIRCFGAWFGYDPKHTDGTFASGGAEANHTALLAALTDAFPDYPVRGVRALAEQPVFYVSSESHHSFLKAARISGIGLDAVRQIEVDDRLRMVPAALQAAIARDRAAGFGPFLVVATAGTTNAGVIDPLAELAEIAARERLWCHVDAAWGGAAVLVPELRPLLDGIASADSITFDAHKWLSVPMGAGVFLTRHTEILHRTFRTQTAYMPREAAGLDVIDPHLHSLQWSRRFTGLKVFLSLLVAGRSGYEQAIRRHTALGDLLRDELRANGWTIENETPLPVVCFSDPGGADPHAIVMRIVSSGEAWISTTQVKGRTVLRACITNYRTGPEDIQALLESLNQARESERASREMQQKAVTF
ncbi:MAG TPA: pyridoxal-dependent decarboxylase [Bryobacteraceae bacterium]|nr:pyridoxal-dependent decarboxylase [Bryobacteraceae bacterium]